MKDRFYWLLAAIGVAAALLTLRQMHWGPWAFSDSAAYISAARNLVDGHGLSVLEPSGGYTPLTLHQPLYPFVMAAFLLIGIHPFTSTLAINVLSAFAALFALSAGVYALTRSRALALLLAFGLASFPPMMDNLGGAMSEPLYLALMLAGFMLLQLYIARVPRRWALYAAAACAGLTVLARLVGAANVAAGAVALLALSPVGLRERVKDAALFAAIGLLPTLAWQLSLPALAGRSFELPADLWLRVAEFWHSLVSVLGSWLPLRAAWGLPGIVNKGFAAVVALLLAASLIAAAWHALRARPPATWARLALTAGVQAIAYALVCLAAFALSNVTPDINDRTMLPLFPLLLLLAGSGLLGLLTRWPKAASAALAALTALALLAWAPVTEKLVSERYEMGHGYTASYYRGSLLLQAARQLPQDVPWISNEPALFLLYLNKTAYDLRVIYPSILVDNNPPFGEGDTEFDRMMREDSAILLLYPLQIKASLGEWAVPHFDNLTRGLNPLYDGADGSILTYPE
ncbi:MAG: hypothetical protein KF701_02570 [Anaerolineales bacterium]|nr:MAG: hypothetical protein KF701_02570 [Anaerolineales bacterium]